jgi:hypothetical protein
LEIRQLAKVYWTFTNCREYRGYIGESSLNFRQLANIQGVYWRKSTELSPIGEYPEGALAKVHWMFANGESPVGEIPIGERPITRIDMMYRCREREEEQRE